MAVWEGSSAGGGGQLVPCVSYESALRGDERKREKSGPCVAGRENRVCLFFNCVETLCIVAKDLF